MSFVMMVLLFGLYSDKVVANLFKVSGDRGLSREFISVVMEDFMGEG